MIEAWCERKNNMHKIVTAIAALLVLGIAHADHRDRCFRGHPVDRAHDVFVEHQITDHPDFEARVPIQCRQQR